MLSTSRWSREGYMPPNNGPRTKLGYDTKDNWRIFKQACLYHIIIYIFNRRKANGVFIATDINLPPDYRFNFLEHFITILPTAYTLQYDKRLCTHWCQMKLQTTLNNFKSTTNTWSWTSRAKHCGNQTMGKWHLNIRFEQLKSILSNQSC